MEKIKLSYLAGIIDGEGTFNITAVRRKDWRRIEYRLKIYVANTDKNLIDWLKKNFGGYVYQIKRKSHWNPRWKDKYEWFLFLDSDCIKLLKSIKPFTVCKKRQLDVALKFLQTIKKSGERLSNKEFNIRKNCKEEMRVLNQRGRQEQRLSERTAKAEATV